MGWDVQFRKGVWLPQIGWWLDARTRQERSFISHAHADHIARHGEVLCSPATARLLHARMPGRRTERLLRFGQPQEISPGVSAILHPAGHILGSSQIHLTAGHGTLLYTGDFKLRPGLAAEPCATPEDDVLVLETTFGLPRSVFPPEAEVIGSLIEFCRRTLADGATPVLLCYSLGKSQEVLRALAPAGLPVMLHEQALFLTRIHEELGVTFPPYRAFDARDVGGHVVICPPQPGRSGLLARIPAPRTAVVTGWALDPGAIYRYQCHAAFPLSDHADFNDLLRFVELVRPRRVLTLHGFAREFAATLRERGWDALALGLGNQLEFSLAG